MHRYLEFAGGKGQVESLAIAIDVSPSMEDMDWMPSRLAGAKEAVSGLLGVKADRYPLDRVGVVAFDSDAKVVHALSPVGSSRMSLEGRVQSLTTGSCTNIAAGLAAAADLLGSRPPRAPRSAIRSVLTRVLYEDPRTASNPVGAQRILLLTDGHSNTGGPPRPLAESLKRSGITIDVVGIGGRTSAVDERLLKKVASARADGSPRYCFIGDKGELIRKFRQLAHHIRPLEK